jgi:hypothetical protein
MPGVRISQVPFKRSKALAFPVLVVRSLYVVHFKGALNSGEAQVFLD